MIDENLYHLYCFTVVAKYLNYTEAAEKLHMTQPALSKMVKTLEKNLGVDLFYRNTRKVELTEAGRLFLDKTISILNEWNDLVKETALVAKGQHGMIRIGFLPYAYADIMPRIMPKFCEQNPDVVTRVLDGEENWLERQLKNGALDVIFVSDWGTDLPDRYIKRTVFEEDYYVVVGKEHPLAGQEYVTFDMLKGEEFLVLNQSDEPRMESDVGKNRVIDLCERYGYLPNIVTSTQARTLLGITVLVAGGQGIAVLAGSMEKYTTEDYAVKFIPIKGLDVKFRGIMCYDRENNNSCIQRLMDVVPDWMA